MSAAQRRRTDIFRKLTIAAVLSAASLVAAIPAASAQTGVTLTFGTGGYSYDDYGDQRYDANGGYAYPQPPNYNYYNYRDRSWQERERREQIERWRHERAREDYWHRQRDEHRGDRDDDDDD
ncbi:hypothetical protein U1839_11005 [Sphingomonas sp. RT2P30]